MPSTAKNPQERQALASRVRRGFTLLELMIVIAIIIILATLGTVRIQQSLQTARIAAQQQDLSVLNKAIQQYTEDKGVPPGSLDDLQTAGYVGSIPVDPVTHQQDWTTEQCDELFSADQTSDQGICAVQVGSDQTSSSDDQSAGSN